MNPGWLSSAALVLLLAQAARPGSTPKTRPAAVSRAPIVLASDKAAELKNAYDAALKANQAFQLAQKDWEAKYNAFMAAEYKARYELGVPQDYVLNLETAAFEPKEKGAPLGPTAPPKKDTDTEKN